MRLIVLLAVSALLAAPKTYTSPQCGGTLLLTLALRAGGEFNVRLPLDSPSDKGDGDLVLQGRENGRGGWHIGVVRHTSGSVTENLIAPGADYSFDSQLDLDAMNLPYYPAFPAPLVLPIRSTGRSLCVRFVNVRASGNGAHAGFLPGSSVEFRVLRTSK